MGKVRSLVFALLVFPLMLVWSQKLDYVYGTSLSAQPVGDLRRGHVFVTDHQSVVVARKFIQTPEGQDIVLFDCLYKAKGDFNPGTKLTKKGSEISIGLTAGLDHSFAFTDAIVDIYPFRPFACVGAIYKEGKTSAVIGAGVEAFVLLSSLFDSNQAIVANTRLRTWASPCIELGRDGLGYGLLYGISAENRLGSFSIGLGCSWVLRLGKAGCFSPSISMEVVL